MNDTLKFMTKDDVKAGRRFYHKDDHHSQEFAFRKNFGRTLYLKRNNFKAVGEITGVFDDGFEVSIWLFNQEAKVRIPYNECIIIEPKL